MFEQFWNGILELTAKFVIPDWGSVIAMLPVAILALSVLVLAVLFWKLARAPKPSRGKQRITPMAPPGVHMPGPSFLPFLGAIGMAMFFLGLVFGEWLLAVGLIAFVVSIAGWMTAARKEYVKTVEADATGHLEALPDPRTPRALLAGLAFLLVAGFVVQAGWLPPREASGAGASGAPPGSGSPPASGEPGASGAPPPSGAASDVTITAQGVAFVETTITAPADKPFTIAFVNNDQGTPHNVALHEGSPTGREAFKGEIFPGVATKVYEVPPLPAGTYGFICTVHPNMTGTATLQ
jgi:plastocyanin